MKYLTFLTFIIFAVSVAAQDYEKSNIIKVGDQIPEFSITSVDGKTITTAELKGKVVLINFFATWCAPCKKELPYIESDIWKVYKDKNFVLLVVGREHTLEQLKAFDKGKYSFSFYADTKREMYSKFAKSYIPRNYLIDQNGKIIFASIGFKDNEFDELKSKIKELVETR